MTAEARKQIGDAYHIYVDLMGVHDTCRIRVTKKQALAILDDAAGFQLLHLYTDSLGNEFLLIAAGQ